MLMSYYGYGYGGLYYDWTYILVLFGFILTLAAQGLVQSAFNRYSRVRSRSGLTGAEAAREVLRAAGIYDVSVERVRGELTDHYDPRTKVLRLSQSTYDSTSVAAVGVAAHECGHAMQKQDGYAPLALRSCLVPAAGFGSQLAWPVFLAGLLLSFGPLMTLGIWLFGLAVLFQLITLPVEINASRRAVRILDETGLTTEEESRAVKRVLTAAAFTYVAALAQSLLQLLRLLILRGGRRRDD